MFRIVTCYSHTLIDRSFEPRMPWHDVAFSTCGAPARDILRHFIQRWNYIKASKASGREYIPLLLPKGEYVAMRDEDATAGTCTMQLLRSASPWSSEVHHEVRPVSCRTGRERL